MAISISVRLLVAALAATLLLASASESPSPSQPPSLPTFPPTQSPSPPPSSASPPPFSAPPPSPVQENQLRNIFDALVGASDFGGWANLLSSADPSAFPLTATIFIPSNDAISGLLSAAGVHFDPLLIPYHIVPQRLTFSELQELPNHTRLPTLLSAKFIVVTDNSPENFTVDGSKIKQADIFLNAAFALHGIDKNLDYSAFDDSVGPLAPAPSKDYSSHKKKPAATAEISGGVRSRDSFHFYLVLFLFKILRDVLIVKGYTRN